MNSVVLVGRLTSDPKLTYTPTTNTAVASFRLAVPKRNREETPNFIQCKVFGRQAEALEKFKCKGDEVAVSGRIDTDSYRNKDGIVVYTTEVICDNVEFTHGSKNKQSADSNFDSDQSVNKSGSEWSGSRGSDDWGDSWQKADDDIPF